MKYFLTILIFPIGTAVFLVVWYLLDKMLISYQIEGLLLDAGAFLIALLVGWATDAILTSFLPAKYK